MSSRIESRSEVSAYINKLRHALDNGAEIGFQIDRVVEKGRSARNTNSNTLASLFPDERPAEALRRELKTLTEEDYIETVKDNAYPDREEMRVFGKAYGRSGGDGTDDVYIKIRVSLFAESGNHKVFVMSFHFAMKAFAPSDFPYRKER